MFKKTQEPQLNLFNSPGNLFSGKSLKIYDNSGEWHNLFRVNVTSRIDENCFKPLYCKNNGTPNASVRVLIAMMILKESEGMSDQKLFENCRFNMLTRSALGLLNVNDPVPTESTYYLFRKRIVEYEAESKQNLFEAVFNQVTKSQSIDFEVSGKRIRMDSKLLGSNIAWLSRYELIHETVRLFYQDIKSSVNLGQDTKDSLDKLLTLDGNKVVYTCSSNEVKTRLQQLGFLIYDILPLFSQTDSVHYQTLKRVFNEQFNVDENKLVIGKNKEEITAQSVQSPHDTDSTYRNKDGDQIKGYAINVTESCDDKSTLNLIGNVDVRNVSTSDVDFLQEGIKKAQEVFTSTTEAAHADGAYHSPDNQRFCKDQNIELHLHAIQGAKGRYKLDLLEDGNLSVIDTLTKQQVESHIIKNKKGVVKWSIKAENGYRYFTQNEVDNYLIRKKIEETPVEILQKRNNVEATIFGYVLQIPTIISILVL